MSDGFLSRWSQRKLASKEQSATSTEVANLEGEGATVSQPLAPTEQQVSFENASALQELPLPTEADLEQVRQGGDVKAFLSSKVSSDLKNKAFKALFSRPEFNQMDGLDIYIDDYNVFTPMTAEDIGKMSMSKQLLSRPDLEETIQQVLDLAEPETHPENSTVGLSESVSPPPDSMEKQGDSPMDSALPDQSIAHADSQNPRVSPSEDSCGPSGFSPSK